MQFCMWLGQACRLAQKAGYKLLTPELGLGSPADSFVKCVVTDVNWKASNSFIDFNARA